ncbi:MAG: DMT family transporter [Rikenellaceae bacterium]|nr:DMT family transporter [Rikenellaceae bacterium]
MNKHNRSLYMGGLVVIFWATVATAFKIALSEMCYVQLLLISSITALIICTFELFRTGKAGMVIHTAIDNGARRLPLLMLQALLTPFLYYLVLFKAYSLLPAQIAQPLNYSWQVVLILMMSVLYKQHLKLSQIFGVLICFAGVVSLSLNEKADLSGNLSIEGIFWALGSSVIWASYWISKLKNEIDPIVELFYNFLFGTIYLAILSLFYPLEWTSTRGLLAGIYVGIFEMGLTFILWTKALRLAENKIVLTQITYLSPLLSLIFIHYVLGESITPLTFSGLILVIGGIYIGNRKGISGKST